MNPFLIIAALLILYSLKNYKQVFFLFLAFRLFLNNNINLINLPGVPLLTLEVFMSIFFALLYVIKRKRYSRVITTSPLPFNKAFIWVLLSYVVSSFISIAGIQNTFTSLLSVVFCDFISAYLCWMLISSKEDILKVVNILLGASLIICTYAFIEKFLGYNPVMDYEIDLAGSRATDWQYLEDERGTRVQSFFLHPIGGSINFGLIFCLCLYGYVYYKAYFSKLQQKTMLLVGIMAFIASLLSNSRTPLVFLAVGILPLINLKNKQSVRILAFAVISIIVLMPYLDFVENLIVSVLNPEKTEIRGSSLEMRQDQFEAAYILMSKSPIWGLGQKATLYFPDRILVGRLLGLESIWIWIMVERGILGIITYCIFIFTLCRLGWHSRGKCLFFLPLAFIAASTVSSTPGMHLYLFYLVYILIYKIDRNRSRINKRNNGSFSHHC
jgi:hypothetical protein